MKKFFLLALAFLFFNVCCAQPFQLAPPVLQYSSVFFEKNLVVPIKFEQPGTKIYYTLNNADPSEKNVVYVSPLVLSKNLTTLKARVFGKDFLPSETVRATFIKDGLKIKETKQTESNEKYPGNGAQTLFDNEGGIADLNSKNFFGYQEDSVEIDVTLNKKEKVDSLLIDFLQDEGSWVFLPQKIEAYYFDGVSKNYMLMSQKEISSNTLINESSTVFEILRSNRKIMTDKLKIIITPLQSMPDGHPGKGKQSWLFIDEIKIY